MNYKEHIDFLRKTKRITEEEYKEAIAFDSITGKDLDIW